MIAHGKPEEGRHIIWAVQPNARSFAIDDPSVNMEINDITRTIIEEREATEESSFKMVLKDGPQRFRHRTLLGMVGQMMQQMGGVNLITYVSCLAHTCDA